MLVTVCASWGEPNTAGSEKKLKSCVTLELKLLCEKALQKAALRRGRSAMALRQTRNDGHSNVERKNRKVARQAGNVVARLFGLNRPQP
jgi:hypothetical protein